MILAGDIGGTKTRLALFEGGSATNFRRQQIETYDSQSYVGLGDLINQFLTTHRASADSACFGVAGPVINGRAKFTNLAWTLDENEIISRSGISHVKLVNDLVATAAAVPNLEQKDLLTLHPGASPVDSAPCAVLAPGTGLGVGFLICHSGVYKALPSEGGHTDFAPTTNIEVKLLQYLMTQFKHVSYERILCGQGLINIYEFLKKNNSIEDSMEMKQHFKTNDPAAVISTLGLTGEHQLCSQALNIFVSVLGAYAGNLALTLLASGGIFLGGGIPPKIIKKLKDGTILSAYLNKGRLSHAVRRTPLHVITDDHAAVHGAASIAFQLRSSYNK